MAKEMDGPITLEVRGNGEWVIAILRNRNAGREIARISQEFVANVPGAFDAWVAGMDAVLGRLYEHLGMPALRVEHRNPPNPEDN